MIIIGSSLVWDPLGLLTIIPPQYNLTVKSFVLCHQLCSNSHSISTFICVGRHGRVIQRQRKQQRGRQWVARCSFREKSTEVTAPHCLYAMSNHYPVESCAYFKSFSLGFLTGLNIFQFCSNYYHFILLIMSLSFHWELAFN